MREVQLSIGPATPYPRDEGIDELFRQACRRDPDHTAVIFGSQCWSYAELDRRAGQWADDLLASGLECEQPVGILVEPGFDQIVAQLAVLRAGGTCVPLDPAFPDARLAELTRNLGVMRAIARRASSRRLPLKHIACIDEVPLSAPHRDPRPVGGGHRTHLLHTSGSTGRPKGVEILARGVARLAFNRTFAPLSKSDRVAHMSNPSFDASLFEVWGALLAGATVVVLPKQTIVDPFALRDAIRRHAISVMFVTTALFNLTARACPDAFRGVRHLLTGGEVANVYAFRTALLHSAPDNLRHVYGPTECTTFATSMRVTLDDLPADGRLGIGQAIDHTQACILDDNQQPVGAGLSGELCLGGDGLARGYANAPERTSERFVCVPLVPGGEPQRLYRTGDVARWREGGGIDFLGRRDRQVKLRGFRIELEEIESVILTSGLASCAVVDLVRPREAEPYLIAYVVLAPGNDGTALLREHLRKSLPDYMHPRLRQVDHIPLNAHGKADREALRRQLCGASSMDTPSTGERFATPIGRALAGIWCRLLDVGKVQAADDFFALGGTSLQAAAMIVALQEEFQQQVSIQTLHEHPTLAKLAAYLEEHESDSGLVEVEDTLAALRVDSALARRIAARDGDPVDWRRADEGRVVLTGATGFLGAYFLQGLLRHPHVQGVTCLVRAASAVDGLDRVRRNLEAYGLWNDAWRSRLHVVTGDLADRSLGRGEAGFRGLGSWASVIFHLGAHVDYTQPYAAHRPANVLGTLHVLELARSVRPVPLHYVSSIAAYGPTGYFTGTAELPEDAPLEPHLQCLKYDTGYSQSQWSAERIVRTAQGAGMPVAVYRPGFIIGDSANGRANGNDFVARLIRGCLQIGGYPRLVQQTKEFVTVDYVCQALLTIASDPANLGRAYNLVPLERESAPDLMGLFDLLGTVVRRLEELPYAAWLERLQGHPGLHENPLFPLLPMLSEPVFGPLTRWEVYQHMPVYRTDNTRRALAGRVPCPVLDASLLKRHLRSWGVGAEAGSVMTCGRPATSC